MAEDWIRMRTSLYLDPKVSIITDRLLDPDGQLAAYVNQNCQRDMTVTRNVMRNVTVGALVALWGTIRHTGKRVGDDLFIAGVTVHVCDDMTNVPGFGAAMEAAGWVVDSEEGVFFPKFFAEHNADPAITARAKAAERQRKYRSKRNVTRDVTQNVTVTSRNALEKRREEKSICNTGVLQIGHSHVFVPPTLEEVGEWIAASGLSVDAEEFHAYYEANGWRRGKRGAPITEWRKVLVAWEKNQAKQQEDVF